MTTKAFEWAVATTTTTGAASSNAAGVTIPTGAGVNGHVQVVGKNDANGDTVIFSGYYGARNVSGTVTVLGTGVIPQISADASVNATTATATASGTSVVIAVLGVVGVNMHWCVSNRPLNYVP